MASASEHGRQTQVKAHQAGDDDGQVCLPNDSLPHNNHLG